MTSEHPLQPTGLPRPHDRPTPDGLVIRAISAIGVEVPMTFALGTSAATITQAPLMLIDLETEQGITGRSYLFCYLRGVMPAIAKLLEEVSRLVQGEQVAPGHLWVKLARNFKLMGIHGIVRMAMSAVDVAAW